MLRRFQNYIENSTWEQLLEEDGRTLRRVCWGILLAAALYCAGASVGVICHVPLQ